MCTAMTYHTKDFYFGRNFDFEKSFGESVTMTPKNFPIVLKNGEVIKNHYSVMGMACVKDNYPLYYDAVNEKGFCVAALNFTDNAVYSSPKPCKENISYFEFVLWLSAKCVNVAEARKLLKNVNITDVRFSSKTSVSELHWILADKSECVTVESVSGGLFVYDNPVGVLTNNPPFPQQMFSLNNYMHLSSKNPKNTFAPGIDLKDYSRGMGGIGLPGDWSSQSRFVRSAFVRANARFENSENESVGRFFQMLDTVSQPKGCCDVGGKYEVTLYSACCNADKGIYYYTTYDSRQIHAVNLRRTNTLGNELVVYPVDTCQNIFFVN